MPLHDICILYIDGGTTRTRTWAVAGNRVVAAERVGVGVRYTAREGSSRRLAEAIRFPDPDGLEVQLAAPGHGA